jgi:hypothetical protein
VDYIPSGNWKGRPSAGLPGKGPSRKILGGRAPTPPSARFGGINLATLETHVRGRADATAEVMINVAYLKAAGLANSYAIVGHTGAMYQAATAERENPYAHRMPCNPTLNIWSLPELVRHRTTALQEALIRPLAVGDVLPRVVNYADNHFENSGACETVDRAVQFVIHEQDTGKRVNTNLIRHVIDGIILPGYAQAYERALDTVSRLADSDRYDYFKGNRLMSPGFDPGLVNDLSLAMRPDPGQRPTDAIDSAKDTLWMYELQHRSYRPPLAVGERITEHVDRLRASDAPLGAAVGGTSTGGSGE